MGDMNSGLYVIGISGKLCSGKTTLARALSLQLPESRVYGFAGQLKEDVEFLTQAEIIPENKDAFRPLLQAYGQLMRRLYGGTYWCERWFTYNWSMGYKLVIIDDLRFPEEFDFLKNQESGIARFIPVRIQIRQDQQAERYKSIYGVYPKQDILLEESETALDNQLGFDVYLSAVAPTNLQVNQVMKFVQAYEFPGAPALVISTKGTPYPEVDELDWEWEEKWIENRAP